MLGYCSLYTFVCINAHGCPELIVLYCQRIVRFIHDFIILFNDLTVLILFCGDPVINKYRYFGMRVENK